VHWRLWLQSLCPCQAQAEKGLLLWLLMLLLLLLLLLLVVLLLQRLLEQGFLFWEQLPHRRRCCLAFGFRIAHLQHHRHHRQTKMLRVASWLELELGLGSDRELEQRRLQEEFLEQEERQEGQEQQEGKKQQEQQGLVLLCCRPTLCSDCCRCRCRLLCVVPIASLRRLLAWRRVAAGLQEHWFQMQKRHRQLILRTSLVTLWVCWWCWCRKDRRH